MVFTSDSYIQQMPNSAAKHIAEINIKKSLSIFIFLGQDFIAGSFFANMHIQQMDF